MASTRESIMARASWSSGFTGASVREQLPKMTLVTPCCGENVQSGSHVTWASKWQWLSMNPGATTRSSASMVRLRRAGEAAHVCDAPVHDADVGDEGGHARSVGDSPVPDQQVVHGALLRAVLWRKPTPPGDVGQGRGQGGGSVFTAPELIPFDTVLSRVRARCSGARVNCTRADVLCATAACHTIDVQPVPSPHSLRTPVAAERCFDSAALRSA